MDRVSSCGRDHPCFMDSGIEGSSCSCGAPWSEKGPAGPWVLLWQGLLGPVRRSWSSLPVSYESYIPRQEKQTNKVSKYKKRKCSPKISDDPSINNDSEYDNLCFKLVV